MAFAYAFRSGHIGFGDIIPEGAMSLGKGDLKELLDLISGVARLAYDNETYLVPGIPEAETDAEALAAFTKFWTLVQERLNAVQAAE